MKKILIIPDPSIPLSYFSRFGCSIVAHKIATYLSKKYDITLLANVDQKNKTEYNIFDISGLFHKQYLVKSLSEFILNQQKNYDIFNIHLTFPGILRYVNEFPLELRKKIYITWHSWVEDPIITFYNRDFIIESLKKVTHIFGSSMQKYKLLDLLNIEDSNNLKIIYNGIENIDVSSLPNTTHLIPSSLNYQYSIFVGRINQTKDPLKVINACINSNNHLILVGQVPKVDDEFIDTNKYIQEVLYKTKKYTNIQHFKYLRNDELLSLIHKAKNIVITSTFDIFSMALLEAARLRTPIIINNHLWTKDVYHFFKDCGLIQFNGNVDELTQILKVHNGERMMYRSFPKQLTMNFMINEYNKLFLN